MSLSVRLFLRPVIRSSSIVSTNGPLSHLLRHGSGDIRSAVCAGLGIICNPALCGGNHSRASDNSSRNRLNDFLLRGHDNEISQLG